MTLPGQVIETPDGLKGFDCNEHLSTATAAAFRADGYRFAIRYVPRHTPNPGDLSASEASGILAARLGIMVVQHVKKPLWWPTGDMGKEYGAFAANSCDAIGVPPGVTVWCDLEGVDPETDNRDTIAFLNNWLDQVGHAGYTPGLYVGDHPDLSAEELYHKLRFEHYWSAYNLNADQVPVIRGVQMKQKTEKLLHGVRIDPDEIVRDAKGGLPLMLVDTDWTAE